MTSRPRLRSGRPFFPIRSSKEAVYVAIMLCCCLLLAGSYGSLWYADQLRVYPPDYCPTGTFAQKRAGVTVSGHTAILIDTSDKVGPSDSEAAFAAIDSWTRDTAPFRRISIHELPETEHRRVQSEFRSYCVPKTGEDANDLYENPRYVEAEFLRFLGTLKEMFRELISREEAVSSPIVEAMAYLGRQDDSLDSIILVSDMLQNTDAWSHYPSRRELIAPSSMPEACTQLRDSGVKTVYLYHIDRDSDFQRWPDPWWNRCVGEEKFKLLN